MVCGWLDCGQCNPKQCGRKQLHEQENQTVKPQFPAGREVHCKAELSKQAVKAGCEGGMRRQAIKAGCEGRL